METASAGREVKLIEIIPSRYLCDLSIASCADNAHGILSMLSLLQTVE